MHTYESVSRFENDYGHIGFKGRQSIQGLSLSIKTRRLDALLRLAGNPIRRTGPQAGRDTPRHALTGVAATRRPTVAAARALRVSGAPGTAAAVAAGRPSSAGAPAAAPARWPAGCPSPSE